MQQDLRSALRRAVLSDSELKAGLMIHHGCRLNGATLPTGLVRRIAFNSACVMRLFQEAPIPHPRIIVLQLDCVNE